MTSQVTQADPTLLIQIEKLVHGGRGLAHQESLALFVEGVLPGEQVRVQPGRIKKGYGEAQLLEVVQPSPDRVAAPCPVYGRCGGCRLQHASATAQLAIKRDILAETLARIGGLREIHVPPLAASPEVYGYRSRARLAVVSTRCNSGATGAPSRGAPSLAYFEEGSHRPVPIAQCPLLAPRLNEAVSHLNQMLAGSRAAASQLQEIRLGLSVTTGEVVFQYMAEQCQRPQAEAWFERVRAGFAGVKGQVMIAGRGPQQRRWMEGDATLTEQVGPLRLRCSDRSFVQANWKLNETLAETVTSWAMEAKTDAPLRVLELYAGIGNFGLAIAREGTLVTFVEGNSSALADARYNARVNHIGRCRFRSESAEAFLAGASPGEYDLVLMDPPRTGLSKEALAGLVHLKPGRILYLSCDPPTLARDLRAMQETGYRVTRLQGYDMFPQTMHIETLVELAAAG
ncbi:MAG: 23S rRNA (uracil(1939)-C(5))-methyltransferase RlmD [Nitrospirae bacterium]|nr:23S rRNA (uracil(1939)-C(5))-methyltransferase RlmD [Nitrospirota bacterium]